MSQVSFSANGKEVKNAYDSIISGESSFEWALYGYEDGSNEIELVDSGNGLEQLCDEFDEEEYQYAFARVTDPNTKLPRFVFISWCGESVPFTKKGMYNTFTNDVLKYFSGFHIHINARSKFDVDPDEIMKKVKSCSGANYSFHQNQAAKNKTFNNPPKVEPKIELKAEENKPQAYPSLPKKNPLNSGSNDTAPKTNPLNNSSEQVAPSLPKRNPLNSGNDTEQKSNLLNPVNNNTSERDDPSPNRRRSSYDYNPLKPNASRRSSSVAVVENEVPEKKSGSVENIREAFEKMNKSEPETKEDVSKVCAGSISSRINAFQNQIQETNENNRKEQAIKKDLSSKNLKTWVPKPAEPVKEEPPKPAPAPVKETIPVPEPEPVQEQEPEPVPEPEPVQADEPAPSKPNIQEGLTVKALYSYEAAEEGELSFDENEILTNVVEIPGEGWWSGNNTKGEYGMFPSNYVSTDLNAVGESEVVVEEKSNKPTLKNSDNNLTAVALYSYEAQDETEISFEEGELITDIVLQDENWGIGVNQNSQSGMFPLNYVELKQ